VKDVMIKQHQLFPKPLEDYESVRVWGENIVTAPSEGFEWKKHRYARRLSLSLPPHAHES
jgi:hypothetical protein